MTWNAAKIRLRKAILALERFFHLSVLTRKVLIYEATDAVVKTAVVYCQRALKQRIVNARELEFLHRQVYSALSEGCIERSSVYCIEVPDCRYRVGSGRLFDRNGNIIADGDYNFRWGTPQNVFVGYQREDLVYDDGNVTSIVTGDCSNYYHWVIDGLLRLYSLEAWGGPVTLVLPDTASTLMRESVALCAPDNVSVRYLPPHSTVRCKSFIVPSFVCNSQAWMIPSWHIEQMRHYIHKRISTEVASPRRIYITRAKASKRKLVNEEELLRVVRAYDFIVLDTMGMKFEEQVMTYSKAEIIVAPHGAGLTNMIFAPKSCRVLELCNRNSDAFFFYLALSLGLEYRCIYPLEYNVQPKTSNIQGPVNAKRHADISFDISEFESELKQCI